METDKTNAIPDTIIDLNDGVHRIHKYWQEATMTALCRMDVWLLEMLLTSGVTKVCSRLIKDPDGSN